MAIFWRVRLKKETIIAERILRHAELYLLSDAVSNGVVESNVAVPLDYSEPLDILFKLRMLVVRDMYLNQ